MEQPQAPDLECLNPHAFLGPENSIKTIDAGFADDRIVVFSAVYWRTWKCPHKNPYCYLFAP